MVGIPGCGVTGINTFFPHARHKNRGRIVRKRKIFVFMYLGEEKVRWTIKKGLDIIIVQALCYRKG